MRTSDSADGACRIHPTAIVEPGVGIGPGSSIWDSVHIRGPATIGRDCIIGEKTYIAYGVTIGDLVKINAQAYICTGVTIEDHVMISAGVIFTNDRYPRACDRDSGGLATSAATEDTSHTQVCEGATIGAGALIGPGVQIGRHAMVGMGAVVTADVPAHGLVVGNPARLRGYVCICGTPLRIVAPIANLHECPRCQRRFDLSTSPLPLNPRTLAPSSPIPEV